CRQEKDQPGKAVFHFPAAAPLDRSANFILPVKFQMSLHHSSKNSTWSKNWLSGSTAGNYAALPDRVCMQARQVKMAIQNTPESLQAGRVYLTQEGRVHRTPPDPNCFCSSSGLRARKKSLRTSDWQPLRQ